METIELEEVCRILSSVHVTPGMVCKSLSQMSGK